MCFTKRFSRWQWGTLTLAALAAVMTGCSSSKPPPRFVDGVPWAVREHGATDAKTQRVTGQPGLRMDAVLLDKLDIAMRQDDLAEARTQASTLLEEAHQLGLQSVSSELARLDDASWNELAKQYYGSEVPVDETVKQQLAEEFRRETDLQLWFLQREVAEAKDVAQVRMILAEIRGQTEESIKTAGRVGRAAPLAVFALPAKITQESIHKQELTCQPDGKFESIVRYSPSDTLDPTMARVDSEHWDLLMRNAPVFVQEKKSSIDYAATVDLIGRVGLANDDSVQIDTTQPTVYAYSRTVLLGDESHVQLIYAIWYSEHPVLKKPIDAEAGKIDGATIRITLDKEMKPAVFETLNNCGCHHRVYPSTALEAKSKAQYNEPGKGKMYVLERDVQGKYDLIIPKLIEPAADAHPLVRCRAGTHAVVDVDYQVRRADEPTVETRNYLILPYDELEQLKTPDGRTVGMFEDNGLVRGAERMEGAIFTPLGMLSAGQPRQRGTQLINWDQFDFDDPRLLERTLRLPDTF